MKDGERLYLICNKHGLISLEDEPEKAAKKANEMGADIILQVIVETMFKNDHRLDWTINDHGSIQ